MRTRILSGIGLMLACWANNARAEDVIWRTAKSPSGPAPIVRLGLPEPLANEPGVSTASFAPASSNALVSVVRAQVAEVPPAPAFPGGPSPYTSVPPGAVPYNGGIVNSDADLGFWSRMGQGIKRCWSDVTGSVGGTFQSGPDHKMFQCDPGFRNFSSPVSNPFYAQDPRALTEFRPVFIWQHTPNSNPIFAGGNNFVLAATGSVAFTPHISLVFNRLGYDWSEPRHPNAQISSGHGFSDVMLGPKFTFIRNETSNTVAAIGLTFDIPAGSSTVQQNTGHLMLDPYFTIAQAFGRSTYGSFDFMNTTGYNFRTDQTRTESFYSSFHLDYNVGNLNRFYPLAELNWRYYSRNGGSRNLNFEGNDIANFGSEHVAGLNELTLALGGRFVVNNYIQLGIAGEFNTLPNSGGRHLDQFRMTADVIFRY